MAHSVRRRDKSDARFTRSSLRRRLPPCRGRRRRLRRQAPIELRQTRRSASQRPDDSGRCRSSPSRRLRPSRMNVPRAKVDDRQRASRTTSRWSREPRQREVKMTTVRRARLKPTNDVGKTTTQPNRREAVICYTLSSLNRFSHFFHCWNVYKICYKTFYCFPPHL